MLSRFKRYGFFPTSAYSSPFGGKKNRVSSFSLISSPRRRCVSSSERLAIRLGKGRFS